MTTRDAGDEGLTLIELMIALFVLGVVMVGIANLSISAMRVTVINSDRSIATNLAQTEIERLRTLTFTELEAMENVPFTATIASGSGDFQLAREVAWETLAAETDTCSEPTGSTIRALLRVDVAVSPITSPQTVSRSTTQIARPPTTPTSGTGALAVRVADHENEPLGFMDVTVRGETGNVVASGATDEMGCIIFLDLAPDAYDVTVSAPSGDHVSFYGPNSSSPTLEAGVQINTRTVLDVPYAPKGSVALRAAVPGDDGSVLYPTNLPVTLGRDGLVVSGPRDTMIDPMWPDRWDLWAGNCPAADPLGEDEFGARIWTDGVRQDPIELAPGGPDEALAVMARARTSFASTLDLAQYEISDFQLAGFDPSTFGTLDLATVAPFIWQKSMTVNDVTATSVDPCSNGTPVHDFDLGPGRTTSPIDLALPYGTWQLDLRAAWEVCVLSTPGTCDPNIPLPIIPLYGRTTVTVTPGEATVMAAPFTWQGSPG